MNDVKFRTTAVLLTLAIGWTVVERAAAIDFLFSEKQPVQSAFGRFHALHAADVDGDGDVDILGATSGDDAILWWENTSGDGAAWSEHIVDDDFWVAVSVHGADVDGDGDVDILGAAYLDDDITWWENLSGDGLAWTEHTLNGHFDGAISVRTGDLDGDGDLDVVAAAQDADKIAWWENRAGDGSAWAEHLVDGNIVTARSVNAMDVDGDADLDIVGAAHDANEIAWWENTAGDGTAWTKHVVDTFFRVAVFAYAADLDGDGDQDIVGAAERDDEIAWWENTAGDGTAWTKHVLDDFFDQANSVHAADVDGDGDVDILGTALRANDIAWWENAAGNGTAWSEHTVDGNFDGISVYAADVDGDRDLDILGAAFDPGEIAWWENQTAPPPPSPGGIPINPGFTDAWFNPETPGQGFFITVFEEIEMMFLAWFTYDTERPPEDVGALLGEPGHRWLTAQGPYSGATASLTIYLTEGGVFDSADPPAHNDGIGDGTMSIEFADCANGLVSYEIASPNVSGELPIQRITNDRAALCETISSK